MITMEYAGNFGLAAFGAMTPDQIESQLIDLRLDGLPDEQKIEKLVAYLLALSEVDRKTTLAMLEAEIGLESKKAAERPQDVALFVEVKRRLAEAERGFLAKYWWLWTLLGVVGVTGFGLIVYRTTRKPKRRRR